jgi:hypothetical protein
MTSKLLGRICGIHWKIPMLFLLLSYLDPTPCPTSDNTALPLPYSSSCFSDCSRYSLPMQTGFKSGEDGTKQDDRKKQGLLPNYCPTKNYYFFVLLKGGAHDGAPGELFITFLCKLNFLPTSPTMS